MFNVSPETLADWQEYGDPPANEAQLAHLHRLAPLPLPSDYLDFVSTYGFAQWDISVPGTLTYRLSGGGGVVETPVHLAHLRSPSGIEQLRKYSWSDNPANGFPVAPDHMFPIGGTAGQDLVLLDLTDGSVWFLPEGREDPWGTGDNTELGAVAPTFTDFINGLRSSEP